MFTLLSTLQGCDVILPFLSYNLDFILCEILFNAICFTCSIIVNGVAVFSNIRTFCLRISINKLWYFFSLNSISVYGVIWPSLSPCTIISLILLITYLLTYCYNIPSYDVSLLCIITYEIQCPPLKMQHSIHCGQTSNISGTLVTNSNWNLVGWCKVKLLISAISLKFSGTMHRTMKQITTKMAMLGQFLSVPLNFEIFHDRLGPGRWNGGNHIMAWNLVAWCSLPWRGSLYEIATLS